MRIFTEENIELVKQSLGEEKIPLYILREFIATEREFAASPANEIIQILEAVDKTLSENPLTIPNLFSILERRTMEKVANAYASLSEANREIAKGLNNFTQIYPEFIKEREKQEAEILEKAIKTMRSVKEKIENTEKNLTSKIEESGNELRQEIKNCCDKITADIEEGRNGIAYKLKEYKNDLEKMVKNEIEKTGENLRKKIDESEDEVKRYIEDRSKEIKDVTNRLHEYNINLKEMLEDIRSAAFDTKTNTTEIMNKLENLEEQVLNPLKNDVETLKNSIEIYTNEISEKYKEISSVLEELQGKVSALKDRVPEDFKEKLEEYENKINAARELVYSRIERHEKMYHGMK